MEQVNFLEKALWRYAEAHSSAPDNLVMGLERETGLTMLSPQMLSGRIQGRLLSLFSRLLRPKNILEIGTFTGYSALCLAEGLPSDGALHTIEYREEQVEIIEKYFTASPYASQLHLYIGKALDIIPSIGGNFDLVFIDADKPNYPAYYEMVVDRLNPGGLLIADNVLWYGKVTDNQKTGDALILDTFNKKVAEDKRLETLLLPLRDGLLVCQKK